MMAIDVSTLVSSGKFVPFRTARRGGRYGKDPVGTLFIDAGATGAAGGGTVTLRIAMARIEFGFHPLFVPTVINTFDTLATPEEVQLFYDSAGNERVVDGSSGIRQTELAVAGASSNDLVFTVPGFVIEPDQVAAADVLDFVWATNTDTILYHAHVFGMLFDAEIIAREESEISELLMGVR